MSATNLGKVSIVPKGEYNELIPYKRQDLVTNDGNTYLALADSTGAPLTDTTKWMLLIDTSPLEDMILVQDTEPTEEDNKIWLPETVGEGVQVPTYDEFSDLNDRIPSAPSVNGSYILTCTVLNGTVTYAWVNTNI